MNSVLRTITLILTLALMSGACVSAQFDHPTRSAALEPSPPLSPPASAPLQPTQGASLQPTQSKTYYVRTDGGNTDQCNGQTDNPYSGSGTNQNCAWDHPFRALPPGGAARISGGDTLIIGAGSYKMGVGAPGAANCDPDGAWDCTMPPIPGGPDAAHPTRVLGTGWNAGCAHPPELWGTERANWILNLTDASNVEIACLEITDHSGCVEFHADANLSCERDTSPYGDWAAIGLYAEDSSNVRLKDINIHGLAHGGVWAGRLTDWTVENVRIAGNGWVGWDGDIDGDDSNAGTLLFRHWTVEWNGCAETYPGKQPTGCWGQEAGGYGDGVGTGTTGGRWIIEDSAIRHNTQDGLDLLYARLITSSIEIRRTLVAGNAGNQIKVTGPTRIENSIIVGQCGFFEGRPGWNSGDNCRAGGDALVLALRPGNLATVTNSTITGEGTCLIIAACALDQTCNGSEEIRMRNDIFVGQPNFAWPADNTCFAWYDDEPPDDLLPQNPFTTEYAIITGTRFGNVTPCPGDHIFCDIAPGLVNTSISAFDAHLVQGSPAINNGATVGAPPDDFDGRPRDAQPDIGAYEWWLPTAWVYLPLVLNNVASWWRPPVHTTWQWQLTELPVDRSFNADMYDIDLFDNDAGVVAALHAQGRKVICYINVGAWEDWRPDKDQFPPSVIGKDYAGWPGEKWLDIRQINLLAPIMRARFDQCKSKGFDGIEPDNIDGYTNDTGFPLTYQDQLNYNTWLANEAHARGLSIGLKNDADQVNDLLPYFDWAMTEDCFALEWCDLVKPFVAAGKAVFMAEYTDMLTSAQFLNQVCPQATTLNFNAILKERELNAWRQVCP